MKWLKWAIGIAIVAVAAGGLVWAADLGRHGSNAALAESSADPLHVEDILAKKSGLSLETIHKLEAAGLSVAADKGTAAGVLTPNQGNQIKGLAVGPVLDRVLASTAKAAGVSDSALVAGLQQGHSLAQIGAANGVSREVLKANLAGALKSELTVGQAGLVTSAQSAMLSTAFASQLDKLVDFTPRQETH